MTVEDVKNRVNELVINEFCGSRNQFSKNYGLKQSTFNQQMSGYRSLSLETVLAILDANATISAEWLLRGHGSVLKGETHSEASAVTMHCDAPSNTMSQAYDIDAVINGVKAAYSLLLEERDQKIRDLQMQLAEIKVKTA